MSQSYSRKSKQATSTERRRPSEHLKSGLTAFQKTLAFIGSILSIVVATITITNYVNGKKTNTDVKSPTSTVIIDRSNGQSETNTNTESTTSASSNQSNPADGVNTGTSSDTASDTNQTTDSSTDNPTTSPSSQTETASSDSQTQ